jgi:hypothetical protein
MEEYDASKDKIIGKCRIVKLGERIVVIALRRIDGGEPKVAVMKTFVAKRASDEEKWTVTPSGAAILAPVDEGAIVLAGAVGRLEPAAALAVYEETIAFIKGLSSSSEEPAPKGKKAGKGKKKDSSEDE